MKAISKKMSILMMIIVFLTTTSLSFAGIKETKIKSNFTENHCKSKIENELSFEKGVKDILADASSSIITIKYDDKKTNVETLTAALKKLGYSADVLSNESCASKEIKCEKAAKKSCAKTCKGKAPEKKACCAKKEKACCAKKKAACTKSK